MTLVFDQDVLEVDLPLLRGRFNPDELEIQLRRAFRAIEAGPTLAEELQYKLAGYRSYKLHSILHPMRRNAPDLRLVYRIDPTDLYVLAIRERPDVYYVATSRAAQQAP